MVVITTSSRITDFWSSRSSRRPGGRDQQIDAAGKDVGLTLDRNAPPTAFATRKPISVAASSSALWIWIASSRVGASTKPRGRFRLLAPPP